MKPIVIFGAGGHARVVTDAIRTTNEYEVCGYIDELHPEVHGTGFENATVLGDASVLRSLRQAGVAHAAVAVGDNRQRARIADELLRLGFQLPVIAHTTAIIAPTATIEQGTVIFAGAIINPAAHIGRLAIINTAATVDHDCVIGDYAHIAPGVHLAGHVTVGAESLIGVGAAVKLGVTIGSRAVVGLGAAVVRDVPDGAIVVGVPAREIK